MRARVNGKIYELDELPQARKAEETQHRCVVDRFKARGDLQQRLAESFETALKLADGWPDAADGRRKRRGNHLLRTLRLPDCGHSISELEPKLFSFNNPAGACPTCDGWA